MRIPPYYKKPGWQRFFAGVFIGLFIGWGFFIYQFGVVHERLVVEITKHEAQIKKQEETIQILRSDQEEQNEENKKKLTVQDVKVYFKNEKSIKLNELALYELRTSLENELKTVKKKNIETVAGAKDLLFQTIENKVYVINNKRYQVVVKEMYLFTTLELFVEIRLAD